MTEDRRKSEALGLFLPPDAQPSVGAAEIVAALLALAWVGAVLAYAVFAPPAGEGGWLATVLVMLVVLLPLALIWAAVTTLRSVRLLRAEAARLQAAVDAMRNAHLAAQHAAAAVKPVAEVRSDEVAADAAPEAGAGTATFLTRRDPAGVVPSADRKAALVLAQDAVGTEDQPALALGAPAEDLAPVPLAVADFIRALNFPDGPEDHDGFRALRLALQDRAVARLIRSAQDVLTLLSQEGIYMDDLRPDRARPEVWRKFAAGERGRAIAGLGGIRDRSAVALTMTRMREDPVFKDAGHHFLRTFDQAMQGFEARATDAELAEFAETRTARAFMLFGRVTGTFD